MRTYLFTLITMEALSFQGTVVSLVAPGAEGFFGVLAHHAPMIAALRPGPLTLTLEDGQKQTYQIGSGFLTIRDNKATLLTPTVQASSSPVS